MSINHFLNKIKGKSGIDVETVLCLCIIVLVGISSFGLGRLSVDKKEDTSDISILNDNSSVKNIDYIDNNKTEGKIQMNTQDTKNKMYVASKNGKLYYSIGCSGAKRISSANEIWFASKSDAEKSGYTLSSSCK